MIGYIQLCYDRASNRDNNYMQCKLFGDLLMKLPQRQPNFWLAKSKAYFIYSFLKNVNHQKVLQIALQAADDYLDTFRNKQGFRYNQAVKWKKIVEQNLKYFSKKANQHAPSVKK